MRWALLRPTATGVARQQESLQVFLTGPISTLACSLCFSGVSVVGVDKVLNGTSLESASATGLGSTVTRAQMAFQVQRFARTTKKKKQNEWRTRENSRQPMGFRRGRHPSSPNAAIGSHSFALCSMCVVFQADLFEAFANNQKN